MSGRVGANKLMPEEKLLRGKLKHGGKFLPGVEKEIGKLGAVIGLDTVHLIPLRWYHLTSRSRKSAEEQVDLFLVSPQEAWPGELIDGGILKQAQRRVCNTGLRNDLDVHLYPLSWVGRLLVGLGRVRLFTGVVEDNSSLRSTRKRLSGQRV